MCNSSSNAFVWNKLTGLQPEENREKNVCQSFLGFFDEKWHPLAKALDENESYIKFKELAGKDTKWVMLFEAFPNPSKMFSG